MRYTRITVVGVVVGIAASGVLRGDRSSTSTAAAPPSRTRPVVLPREPLGEADGAIPDGTTVFDDAVPGVAKLDPALLDALRRAATAAAADGVGFRVDSGWRSPAYQAHLLQQAIAKYGSADETGPRGPGPPPLPPPSGGA